MISGHAMRNITIKEVPSASFQANCQFGRFRGTSDSCSIVGVAMGVVVVASVPMPLGGVVVLLLDGTLMLGFRVAEDLFDAV